MITMTCVDWFFLLMIAVISDFIHRLLTALIVHTRGMSRH